MTTIRSRRRALLALTTAAGALAVALLPTATASAASGGTGWVRVAHLSPDTAKVDVQLTAVAGGSRDLALSDIAYGGVSKYMSVPDGTYAVAMRPAGAADSTPAVLTTTVDVERGTASTVAVFGRNAHLRPRVLTDDLTPPAAGKARVRLVQASTRSTPVTVRASDGTTVAEDAASGSVSGYAAVPSGDWTLTATQGRSVNRSPVDLAGGEVVSLFVLDAAHGGAVVRRVVDSAGTDATPKGFLATGGGFLAHEERDRTALLAGGAGALAGAGTLVAGIAVLRRRRGGALPTGTRG